MFKALAFFRSLLVTVWFPFHTLLSAVVVFLAGILRLPRAWQDFLMAKLWAYPVLLLAGITVDLRGGERFPKERGALVLFNHTSWIDIIVLMARLPRLPRFGAKIELFRIPVFGSAMRAAGMLPIERRSRTRVLQIYKEAEERARSGECFALAPEGTRQTELTLGRFKQGPFVFAIGAQMPLLPVIVAGARETMPKSALLINNGAWKRKVIIEILPPIPTLGLEEKDITALQESVRQEMEPCYTRLNHELGLLKS